MVSEYTYIRKIYANSQKAEDKISCSRTPDFSQIFTSSLIIMLKLKDKELRKIMVNRSKYRAT